MNAVSLFCFLFQFEMMSLEKIFIGEYFEHKIHLHFNKSDMKQVIIFFHKHIKRLVSLYVGIIRNVIVFVP